MKRLLLTHALRINWTCTIIILAYGLLASQLNWPGATIVAWLGGWSALLGILILVLELRQLNPTLLGLADAQGCVPLIDRCSCCGRQDGEAHLVLPNLCDICAGSEQVEPCMFCGETPDGGEMHAGMELLEENDMYQVACLSCGYTSCASVSPMGAVRCHNLTWQAVQLGRIAEQGGAS